MEKMKSCGLFALLVLLYLPASDAVDSSQGSSTSKTKLVSTASSSSTKLPGASSSVVSSHKTSTPIKTAPASSSRSSTLSSSTSLSTSPTTFSSTPSSTLSSRSASTSSSSSSSTPASTSTTRKTSSSSVSHSVGPGTGESSFQTTNKSKLSTTAAKSVTATTAFSRSSRTIQTTSTIKPTNKVSQNSASLWHRTTENGTTQGISPVLPSTMPNPFSNIFSLLGSGNNTDPSSALNYLLPFLADANSTFGQGLRSTFSKFGISSNITLGIAQLALALQPLLDPENLHSDDQCMADASLYLQSLKGMEIWALRLFDASGKLEKSIMKGNLQFWGNYDECMEFSHTVKNMSTEYEHTMTAKYWQLSFSLPKSISSMFGGSAALAAGTGTYVRFDVCLPASCTKEHIMNATQKLPLSVLGMSAFLPVLSSHRDWTKDPSAIAAVVISCLILSLTVAGTLFDVISDQVIRRKRSVSDPANDSDEEDFGGEVAGSDGNHVTRFVNGFSIVSIETPGSQRDSKTEKQKEMKDEPELGLCRRLLLCFSVGKNTEKILNTKTGEGNLGCVHGIRVLSMAWVILGHSLMWGQTSSYENVADLFGRINDFTMQAMMNGSLSVDSFFVLSGLLVCYLFLRESKKNPEGRPTGRQMGLYYIHRYWRLTPVYMIILMLWAGLMKYTFEGPNDLITHYANGVGENCRRNWWANLLYISNLYSPNDQCLGWSWFLAMDMQFYVFAPLALLPIAFGFTVIGVCVMFASIVVSISTYGHFEWLTEGGQPARPQNNQEYMAKIYYAPWARVGAFAIGMLLGLVMQRIKSKVKLPKYVHIICWQVALAIGLTCTYVTYSEWRDGTDAWTTNDRIAHETLYREGWALFVSWIIFACCTGNGGFINSILAWKGWIPLGRLTYGAYLLHPMVLSYVVYNQRSRLYSDVTSMSYFFVGTFVFSYGVSFLTCVLVESPCLALEKVVLTRFGLKKSTG